ncbi:MAG TPA: amino acid permease, partial [Actinomycetota bacterium]|nr:amino acid permease [Actinomycetota bacterium]
MSLQSLFRTKSLDGILADAERPEFKLRRTLGPVQLTLLGIGAIVGAGIFATVGTAAAGDAHRPGAGPALIVSFLLTALVCAFTALCYAELASMVPISGSAYTYSYATLGELVAWMIGWDLIIEYAVGNIAVAISWANYFKTFVAESFGIVIPHWASMDYRTAARIVDAAGVQTVFRDAPRILGVPIVFNVLAAAIVAALTVILVLGIRESARFNAVMVGIKILVLALFIAVGFSAVRATNWTPFAPNGWAGISAGAAIVFFAYIGFDAVSTVAEETRNPQRDLPAGILASLVICTFLYVVVAAVFTGLVSYPALKAALSTEQAEPLILALRHAVPAGHWSLKFVALGSVVAHTAVLLVFQLGQPRIFFSMARDGLLPPFIARVHPRFRTPHVATILTGLFVALFASLASLDEMVDLTNIGTLFAFMLVCVGVIVLRIKDPARPRPFRVPAGWMVSALVVLGYAVGIYFLPLSSGIAWALIVLGAVVFALTRNHILPVLGVASCLYLVYYLPPTSWLRFAAWLDFGFLIYVAHGSVRSRLTGRDAGGDRLRHDA